MYVILFFLLGCLNKNAIFDVALHHFGTQAFAMTLGKMFEALIVLYWMIFIDDPSTTLACTAKKFELDIAGVVLGDVATCTEKKCFGGDVVIDECKTVVCNDVVTT